MLNYLGKLLFPDLPRWERKRKINTLLIIFTIAVFSAVGVTLLIINITSRHGR